MAGGPHPSTTVDRGVVDMIAAAHPRFPVCSPIRTRKAEPVGHTSPASRSWQAPAASTAESRYERPRRCYPLPHASDHRSAMFGYHLGQKPIMPPQRHLHRLRLGLPQPRGTPNVGQQKRHRPPTATPNRPHPAGYGRRRLAQTRLIVASAKLSLSKLARSSTSSRSNSSRGEVSIRRRAGRANTVDHRRQPWLLVRGRALQDTTASASPGGQPELILQPRDLHPRTTQPYRCQ